MQRTNDKKLNCKLDNHQPFTNMKLKFALLIPLTFLLVACPSEEDDIYINLNNLNIQISCLSNENDLSNTITCEDEFKIYLDFESSEIAQAPVSLSNIGVAYAAYEPLIYLQNKVEKCNITNIEEFNDLAANTEVTKFFDLCIDNSEWIEDLSLVEGINESVILQYKTDAKPYLKLNHNLNYSGRFIVEFELSDGTILSDSTQYFSINISE